jgi:hypothetical protein
VSRSTLQTQVVTEAREFLSRAVRQVIQALIPTLLVIAAGNTHGLNPWAILGLAGITGLVSLLKSTAGLRVGPGAPLWELVGERAVTAAAGTAIGLVTVDGFVPRDAVNWSATMTASIGSALLAAAMYYTNPPVVAAPVDPDVMSPFPEGTTFDPDAEQNDRGDIDVLLILGVLTVVGVALLLFGVSFQ